MPIMRPPLHARRIEAMLRRLLACGAESVLDLGCERGLLLAELLREPRFARVAGVDISPRALVEVADCLRADLDERDGRLTLIRGSFTERDDRLIGFDAATLVETIEHVDPRRLSEVERMVFDHCRPATVLITTPNRDFNALFHRPDGILRHRGHRFEWSRAKFAGWAGGVAARNGYRVELDGVGAPHPAYGPPTQLAHFTRIEPAAATDLQAAPRAPAGSVLRQGGGRDAGWGRTRSW